MYKDIIISTLLVKNMPWVMLRVNRCIETGKLESVMVKTGIFNGRNSNKVRTIYDFDVKKAKSNLRKFLNVETFMTLFFIILIGMFCHDAEMITKQKQEMRKTMKIEFCRDFYSHRNMFEYCMNDFKGIGTN